MLHLLVPLLLVISVLAQRSYGALVLWFVHIVRKQKSLYCDVEQETKIPLLRRRTRKSLYCDGEHENPSIATENRKRKSLYYDGEQETKIPLLRRRTGNENPSIATENRKRKSLYYEKSLYCDGEHVY